MLARQGWRTALLGKCWQPEEQRDERGVRPGADEQAERVHGHPAEKY